MLPLLLLLMLRMETTAQANGLAVAVATVTGVPLTLRGDGFTIVARSRGVLACAVFVGYRDERVPKVVHRPIDG